MLVLGFALALGDRAEGQTRPSPFAGRLLEDVLRDLRAGGLRLAFSSELVTRDMRVEREPRGSTPEAQLKEILEPHALEIRSGPGGILQVVRARRPAPPRQPNPSKSDAAAVPAATDGDTTVTGLITERVIVTAAKDTDRRGHPPNVQILEGVELQAGSAGLVNDPIRLASALPGVVAGDDFRGELSIRGSPYRHTALVVDEVATSWLTHAAPGRGTTSSLSMLRGDVLERATLERGAYARRHGDRLGAQLSLGAPRRIAIGEPFCRVDQRHQHRGNRRGSTRSVARILARCGAA